MAASHYPLVSAIKLWSHLIPPASDIVESPLVTCPDDEWQSHTPHVLFHILMTPPPLLQPVAQHLHIPKIRLVLFEPLKKRPNQLHL